MGFCKWELGWKNKGIHGEHNPLSGLRGNNVVIFPPADVNDHIRSRSDLVKVKLCEPRSDLVQFDRP